MGKHAVEPETGPMPLSAFGAKFCDECRPIYQAMADAMVRSAAENPCPVIYYYKVSDAEYCALRIGTWESTWEVRVRVTEDMMAGPNEVGAWVHWGYFSDPAMAAVLAESEDLATRL